MQDKTNAKCYLVKTHLAKIINHWHTIGVSYSVVTLFLNLKFHFSINPDLRKTLNIYFLIQCQ